MDIGKSKDNFKDRKLKCFNCEIYGHIAKDCKQSKKERDTRKYYECGRTKHIAKDCKTKQKMKNQSIQRDIDIEEKDQKKGFREDPEQAWYEGSM